MTSFVGAEMDNVAVAPSGTFNAYSRFLPLFNLDVEPQAGPSGTSHDDLTPVSLPVAPVPPLDPAAAISVPSLDNLRATIEEHVRIYTDFC